MADFQSSKHCIPVYGKLSETLYNPLYKAESFKSQSLQITIFEYFRHYGPVILLLCMMTSETGLYR